MAQEVTIAIGDSFAAKHEQFSQQLGDNYDMQIRNLVENEIHGITQRLERQAEENQIQGQALEPETEE